MLFDEPTSALDPIATVNIEELMSELKKKLTILIVYSQYATGCSYFGLHSLHVSW